MILTITRNDGTIYQDGIVYPHLNLSFIPSSIHALQWKDTAGWIEYDTDLDGNKPTNDKINILPDWANTAIELCNSLNPINTSWITANLATNVANTSNLT
jgi:hypothetical protein